MQNIFTFFNHIDNLRTKLKISPYIIAVLTVVIATILQFVLQYVLDVENTPLLMYVMVPLIASWFGGFTVGFLSTIASVFVADYLFIKPIGSVLATPSEIGRVPVYLLQGIIVSILNELRNRSQMKILEALHNETIAREQAIEAKKSKEDFISITSHELKNPITSMKAFTQLMQKRVIKDGNNDYEHYLSKIDEQTTSMLRLINDLLSISKLQVGKLEMNKEILDINQCVYEVSEVYSISGAKHKININGKCTNKILGDKVRIIQVLTNLISNAIKYSPEAKEVLIDLFETKNFIFISIHDYGEGISKKDQSQLFKKYFRVHGTNEKKYKGFGMGLYIVSEILKLHSGTIKVKSAKGKGSTFIIKLPTAKDSN